MLLAEIHGKRFGELEGQEDLLTSAVFGHLRHVPPQVFWTDLFKRAASTRTDSKSLELHVQETGNTISRYSSLDVLFWRTCGKYGEPDLILRFAGGNQDPLVVVVEVKLDSGKSGTGSDDQLKRYLDLLDEAAALPFWSPSADNRILVYLTRNFAHDEIKESVRLATASGKHNAVDRIFGLQWQDVLAVADANSNKSFLLQELAAFLRIRDFEAFQGFGLSSALPRASGCFYGRRYFLAPTKTLTLEHKIGRFYGA